MIREETTFHGTVPTTRNFLLSHEIPRTNEPLIYPFPAGAVWDKARLFWNLFSTSCKPAESMRRRKIEPRIHTALYEPIRQYRKLLMPLQSLPWAAGCPEHSRI